MTEAHIENLSALLELGEKSLNEGDYVKLANFLKGLRDSQPANPTPASITLEHIETTVEFETLKGAPMRICLHKMQIERFYGPTPHRRTVWGSINGNELELPYQQFVDKLHNIYDVYGMKNIKRTLPFCEPVVYPKMWDFKVALSEHQIHDSDPENLPDDGPDGWPMEHVIRELFIITI